jgi:aldehyde dehydrogenase (NAD+)
MTQQAVREQSGSAIKRDKFYIDGAWVQPAGSGTIEVVNPTTEEVAGTIPEGTAEDIDRAVAAAKAAFAAWSQTTVEERAKYLQAITAQLGARQEELATTMSTEMGMPVALARLIQAGAPLMTFTSMPGILQQTQFEEQIGNSLVLKEPVGVVGCITPWNYPLHQIAAKVAPALAAGCTVVVKPSEVAPLNAFILAEAIDAAGLPAGVFNLVTGFGPVRRSHRLAPGRGYGFLHRLHPCRTTRE